MITIKKLMKVIIMTILPILLYELGALGFWLINLGMISLEKVHDVAWSQDLAMFIPLLCIVIFVYHTYIEFIEEEEGYINVHRYQGPTHERYKDSVDSDADNP